MKTGFLADVTIEELPVAYGPLKGESRWFVCKAGCPMDVMFDFFAVGKLKVAYPFRRGQRDGHETEEEAKKSLCELREHVACVLALPLRDRPGSSKTWT